MPEPTHALPRRALLQQAAGLGLAVAAGGPQPARGDSAAAAAPQDPFIYCLNTATLRGYKLPLDQQVQIAAQAGYQAIEPWTSDVKQFADGGGSLADLGKQIADRGLRVISAVAFGTWIVDDDAKRAAGLEQYRLEMDQLRQLGGRQIAAPPSGGREPSIPLPVVAERYRALLEIGRQQGVVPELEVWGTSKIFSRLSEALFIAAEAAHPDACLLLDAFQLYRGHSGFESLRLVSGATMHAFHINDYPADPPRETITDASRVYPGDGVAPLDQVFQALAGSGYRGTLSLELFNREYWKGEPLEVARTGLQKTRAAVQRALADHRKETA